MTNSTVGLSVNRRPTFRLNQRYNVLPEKGINCGARDSPSLVFITCVCTLACSRPPEIEVTPSFVCVCCVCILLKPCPQQHHNRLLPLCRHLPFLQSLVRFFFFFVFCVSFFRSDDLRCCQCSGPSAKTAEGHKEG